MAPADEDSTTTIIGNYRIFIFNIGDKRKFQAMARRLPTDQFLNIDVGDSCVLDSIPPMYLGTYRCRGAAYVGGWTKAP